MNYGRARMHYVNIDEELHDDFFRLDDMEKDGLFDTSPDYDKYDIGDNSTLYYSILEAQSEFGRYH
jgi:hypothetical protein